MLHFCPHHRLELILDSAGINLRACDDNTDFPMLIRFEFNQFSVSAQFLCTKNLLLLRHQRNNAHGGKPCPLLHRVMVTQRADGDIPDGIDLPQKLGVHTEHSSFVSKEENLTLRRLGIVSAIHRSHCSHTQRCFLLMDFTRVLFPDEDCFLADVQKLRDILLGDNMTALESGAFKTVTHGCDVMA